MVENAIRDQIARYLSGDISLAEFEDWFVPRAWVAAREGSAAALDLVMQIELLLGEFSSGHRTEDDVKAALSRTLATTVFAVQVAWGMTSLSSNTTTSVSSPTLATGSARQFVAAGT